MKLNSPFKKDAIKDVIYNLETYDVTTVRDSTYVADS
jgi:hypothetical protein